MTWATLEKHGMFATKEPKEAMQYIDDIIGRMPKEERFVAYTAAYVMYNSVIEYYETNMTCTVKGQEGDIDV